MRKGKGRPDVVWSSGKGLNYTSPNVILVTAFQPTRPDDPEKASSHGEVKPAQRDAPER